MTPDEIKFEADVTAERETDEPALVVDVEGFEGPLDLLLALARQQKVDLARISILALADQYLTFIEAARKLRLELAADYLVMAAWLAYLKSRLLLPDANAPAGQSAEDMAIALAMRLKRLEAIRAAAERLFGRLVFGRGARGARAADRQVVRLGAARRISDLVLGRAIACTDGIRVELRLHARNGA
jgi:segregation and condensation protein A